MKNQQGGFTLIEIAIVLVIIGLILGGVLKGQELITSAKIRNVANDFNGISAAYYTYLDRYRTVPGDDGTALNRWPGAVNGGGNGVLVGEWNYILPTGTSPTATNETNLFWQHLRFAGLIAGATSGAEGGNPPNNAVGGITGVQAGALGMTGLVICSGNLPAKIASAIDSQFDDGTPNTGQVRAKEQAGASNPVLAHDATAGLAEAAATYTDDGTKNYVVCKNI